VTAFVTLVGTLFNVVLTGLTAYPSARESARRKLLVNNGGADAHVHRGIVPTYLVVKDAGLINTPWALIVPQVIWSQYLIILKNFMERIPEELLEFGPHRRCQRDQDAVENRHAAVRTHPDHRRDLLRRGPLNEFQQAILYITQPKLWPLQVIVRDILTPISRLPTGSGGAHHDVADGLGGDRQPAHRCGISFIQKFYVPESPAGP
jgi:putative aldouronate transport system permease protein